MTKHDLLNLTYGSSSGLGHSRLPFVRACGRRGNCIDIVNTDDFSVAPLGSLTSEIKCLTKFVSVLQINGYENS
jgi:hypothetical protein